MYAQPLSHITLRKRVLGAAALLLLALSFLLPARPAEAHVGTGYCGVSDMPPTATYLYQFTDTQFYPEAHYHVWQHPGEVYYHLCYLIW